MSSQQPQASVVVATYTDERWEELGECLRSLAGQTAQLLQTIVVVDHNAALLEHARSAFPSVTVIPNTRPRGLAGARNAGVEVASGDVVAFIDDDASAEPTWLEELIGCFSGPQVVGAGGALLPAWRGGEARWMPAEFYWVIGCSYVGLPLELAPVRNPIGANMAVRKSVLGEVGGFREAEDGDAPRALRSRGVVRAAGNLPDDTDLAIRVKQEVPDGVWLYQPRARVSHVVTAERSTLAYFLRRCYEEGVGKANLARYVGADQGLSSERRHLAAVLPPGVLRGLREALGGDPAGLLRAGAIVVGVLTAAAGFLAGAARSSIHRFQSGDLDDPQTSP